jgi:hypothetical protein
VLSFYSCKHVNGKYLVIRKDVELFEPELFSVSAEEDVAYFVQCEVCNKEQYVKFQVDKEHFNNISCGDTIEVDGYFHAKFLNHIGSWYDLTNK